MIFQFFKSRFIILTLQMYLVLLGGAIKIHSLTESQLLRMNIPECTTPDTLLRVKGQGIRDPITTEYGDMLIKVRHYLRTSYSYYLIGKFFILKFFIKYRKFMTVRKS